MQIKWNQLARPRKQLTDDRRTRGFVNPPTTTGFIAQDGFDSIIYLPMKPTKNHLFASVEFPKTADNQSGPTYRKEAENVATLNAELKKINHEPVLETGRRRQGDDGTGGRKERYLERYQQRDFLSRKLVGLLEEEKRKMGNILHDEIGQVLTGIHLQLEELKELEPGQTLQLKESVKNIQTQIRSAIIQTKNISHNLRADTLRQFGLDASIRNLIDDVRKDADLDIHFHQQFPFEALDTEQNLVIFRVVQEALTNILRHAKASRVDISLTLQDDTGCLSIEDDGSGFDYEQMLEEMKADSMSLGINIMRERVFMVDGGFYIDSEPGAGTRIKVKIPLSLSRPAGN